MLRATAKIVLWSAVLVCVAIGAFREWMARVDTQARIDALEGQVTKLFNRVEGIERRQGPSLSRSP